MIQKELLTRIKVRTNKPGESATLNWDFLIPPLIPDALYALAVQNRDHTLLVKKFTTAAISNNSVLLDNLLSGDDSLLLVDDDNGTPFEQVVDETGREFYWLADTDILSRLTMEDDSIGYFNIIGNKLIILTESPYTGTLTLTGTRIPTLATLPKNLESVFIGILLGMIMPAARERNG